MATKKRLADLVREEVNKQNEESDTSQEASTKKASAKKSAGFSTKTSAKSKATKSSSPAKSAKTASDADKALKAKVTALEKENQTLKSDNDKLLTKVSDLESSLEATSKVEASLKSAQTKQKSLQVALDEAKHDALKLAQENQKLLDKIEALESAPAKAAMTKAPAAQPAKKVEARVTQGHAIKRAERPQPIYKAPAKKPFSRPIAPSRMPAPRVVQNSDEFETWCYD